MTPEEMQKAIETLTGAVGSLTEKVGEVTKVNERIDGISRKFGSFEGELKKLAEIKPVDPVKPTEGTPGNTGTQFEAEMAKLQAQQTAMAERQKRLDVKAALMRSGANKEILDDLTTLFLTKNKVEVTEDMQTVVSDDGGASPVDVFVKAFMGSSNAGIFKPAPKPASSDGMRGGAPAAGAVKYADKTYAEIMGARKTDPVGVSEYIRNHLDEFNEKKAKS